MKTDRFSVWWLTIGWTITFCIFWPPLYAIFFFLLKFVDFKTPWCWKNETKTLMNDLFKFSCFFFIWKFRNHSICPHGKKSHFQQLVFIFNFVSSLKNTKYCCSYYIRGLCYTVLFYFLNTGVPTCISELKSLLLIKQVLVEKQLNWLNSVTKFLAVPAFLRIFYLQNPNTFRKKIFRPIFWPTLKPNFCSTEWNKYAHRCTKVGRFSLNFERKPRCTGWTKLPKFWPEFLEFFL